MWSIRQSCSGSLCRGLPRSPRAVRNHWRLESHLHPLQIPSVSARVRTCFEGPFGEVIRATGPMAKANPFRFSTKYQDEETDLLYYGYRYYNASTGRWLSRDPIGEAGGLNLYGFCRNDGCNAVDARGHYPRFAGSCLCVEPKILRRGFNRGCSVIREPGFSTCLAKRLGVEKATKILDCLDALCWYKKDFTVECKDTCPTRRGTAIASGRGSTVTICRDAYYGRDWDDTGLTWIHEFLHLDACGGLKHPPGGQVPGKEPEFDAVEGCYAASAKAWPR